MSNINTYKKLDLKNFKKIIKNRKKELFLFETKYLEDKEEYKIYYKIYLQNLKKSYKGKEYSLILGFLARFCSGFLSGFSIKPNSKFGFDDEIEFSIPKESFEKNINAISDFINSFICSVVGLFKKEKKILTKDNIKVIMNYFDNIDNDLEYVIVFDGKKNNIIPLDFHSSNEKQYQSEIGIKIALTREKFEEISKIKNLSIIHNHKYTLGFSEKDKEVYNKLKGMLGRKFNFMVYSKGQKAILDYDTYTLYHLTDKKSFDILKK